MPDGWLLPCCWTASRLVLPQTKQFLGDRFAQLDASRHSHDEIMRSEAMQMIEQSWSDGSFKVCLQHCPADRMKRATDHHDIPVNQQDIRVDF